MQALMIAAPALGLIGLGVAGIALLGRDPEVDEYTIDDYQPEPASFSFELAERGQQQMQEDLRRPVTVAGNQVFAETAAALGVWPVDAGAVVAVVARRYGDSPAGIAARWLREIAAEQRAGDIVWTSTAERDLTGAFPVVAVA